MSFKVKSIYPAQKIPIVYNRDKILDDIAEELLLQKQNGLPLFPILRAVRILDSVLDFSGSYKKGSPNALSTIKLKMIELFKEKEETSDQKND